jgi:MFS family permease
VRITLTETPAFIAAQEAAPPPRVPIGELFRDHWLPTLAGTVGTVACFALFYIATVFIIGYATKGLGYDRETFLGVELVAILFMAAGIWIASSLADRSSAARVLAIGCVATIAAGLSIGLFVTAGALASLFLWLAGGLFVMGFVYGPLGGWLPSLFPARVRYTGVSVTFNLGGIIGGGLTPLIAAALVEKGGLTLVGYYLASAAVLSLVGLALVSRKNRLA